MKHLFASLFIILSVFGKICAQVSVTATGGTLGPTTYTNLITAFTAVNNGTHTGTITISITADFTQAATAVLNASGSGAANYTAITIKPAAATNPVITNSNDNTAGIKLDGADNITIDGSNNGTTSRNLTFRCSSGGGSGKACNIWLASNGTNGATNNVIKNCRLLGSSNSLGAAYVGVCLLSANTAENRYWMAASNTTGPNSNNLIQNNFFNAANAAIVFNGGAGVGETGNQITGNTIGDPTAATNTRFTNAGIFLLNQSGFDISQNSITWQNATNTNVAPGSISIGAGCTNGFIARNKITGTRFNSTAVLGGGILLNAGTNSNIGVYNNFISDVASVGSATAANNAYGIAINAGSGYNIGYNSVNMNTDPTTTATGFQAALYIASGITGLNIRNNLFVHSGTNTTNKFSVYSASSNPGASVINYNDYYTTASVLAFAGSNQASLANVHTNLQNGSNNSKNVLPVFVSATDLHLVTTNASNTANLAGAGTSIAGITTDIDNSPRGTLPTIGAHELVVVSCVAPASPTATGITPTSAVLNWTQAGTPVSYQIKYGMPGFNASTGGTSIFTPTKPYTLNPPLTPSTSYDYYVRAICSAGDTSAWSAVTSFTTLCNPPAISSTKDSFNYGPGTVTLEATATTGAGIKWYAAATGGTNIGNGNVFVTPSLTTTTNYYAEAVQLSSLGQTGRNDYAGLAQVTPNNTGQGIQFNALANINLDSVAVWVTSDTGTIIVQLQNAANTVIATNTFTFAGTGANATTRRKIYLPVNFSIVTGNNYKILAMPGTTVELSREQTVNPPFAAYNINNVITLVSSWVNGGQNTANYYYFYNLYVSSGCVSPRQMVTATIRPKPTVNLGNDTTICPGVSYTFDAGNAGGTYLWSPGGQTTQTITTNAAGTYSVNVTINGCSKADTIVITPGTTPVNNLQDTVNLCVGDATILDAGNPGSSYSWTQGGAATQTINVNSGGNYAVDVKSIHGCEITSSTYVAMRPLPVDNLGTDTAICNSAVIILDAGNPGESHAWNTGATTQTINVADSGTYTVIVTTPYNCVNSDTIHIAFLEDPRIEGFNFIPKFFEELGKVEFSPLNPTNVLSYEWDFGDGSPLATTMNPVHVYSASGQYTVTLKVYNECTDFSRSQSINVDLPTGVASLAKDNLVLNIYPNPARSVLNISNNNMDCKMQDVMIFNAVGSMVYHHKADSKATHQLSVEDFSSGIYFVRILTDKGFVNQQIQIVK